MRKEINILDRIVNNNLRTNKDQHNDAVENEPKFDNSFNLSSGTRDPLPVVTVSLRGGKKQRAMAVAGLTCLLDRGATNSMIKIIHTKYYELKMRSNKVKYSTSAGLYYTTHDVKVNFCMSEFSSRKIIEHRFHINNNKGELGIGYGMLIGLYLMVQLVLTANFNHY